MKQHNLIRITYASMMYDAVLDCVCCRCCRSKGCQNCQKPHFLRKPEKRLYRTVANFAFAIDRPRVTGWL